MYLRNGKEPRVLCDNGKGDRPIVVMVEDDNANDYMFFVITKPAGGISMVNRVLISCYL